MKVKVSVLYFNLSFQKDFNSPVDFLIIIQKNKLLMNNKLCNGIRYKEISFSKVMSIIIRVSILMLDD